MAAILQICSDAGSPTTGTQALVTLLEAAPFSHTITLRSDETGEDGDDETTYALVFVDESSSSGTVGTDYESYTIPRLLFEAGIWDDYDLISGKSSGQATQVQVDNDGHPVCDSPNDLGTDDTALTITTSDFTIDIATDAATAASRIEFAWRSVNTTNNCFAFEDAATLLNSNTATSRIVCMGWRDDGADILTSTAEDMIENALAWLLPAVVATVYPPFPRRQNTLVRM